jgi:spore germination protein GerM
MKKKLAIIFSFILLVSSAMMVYWYVGGMYEASANLVRTAGEARKVELKETVVKIYFANKKMNPGQADCQGVFSVLRTVANDLIVKRRAIEEILAGPTAEETEQGYYSAIPDKNEVINYREKIKQETGQAPYDGEEVGIRSVKILSGALYIDFSKEIMAYGGDACRAETMRTQLSETAKQFPKISWANVSVEGVENALWP